MGGLAVTSVVKPILRASDTLLMTTEVSTSFTSTDRDSGERTYRLALV